MSDAVKGFILLIIGVLAIIFGITTCVNVFSAIDDIEDIRKSYVGSQVIVDSDTSTILRYNGWNNTYKTSSQLDISTSLVIDSTFKTFKKE